MPQITCLYDMDIVFQPNGNFDEVYLYVGLLASQIDLSQTDKHLNVGRANGS